jgi:hypothetical protein
MLRFRECPFLKFLFQKRIFFYSISKLEAETEDTHFYINEHISIVEPM